MINYDLSGPITHADPSLAVIFLFITFLKVKKSQYVTKVYSVSFSYYLRVRCNPTARGGTVSLRHSRAFLASSEQRYLIVKHKKYTGPFVLLVSVVFP